MSLAASWSYLAVSVVGLAFTAAALLRVRELGALASPWFLGSWLTGELALFHLAWQGLATLGFAALGAFGAWPGLLGLALTFVSWGGLVAAQLRAESAGEVFEAALRAGLGHDYRGWVAPERRAVLREGVPRGELLRPFRMRRPGVQRVRGLAYGDEGQRQTLDVYYPLEPGEARPTLLQIHGGAWTSGRKEDQALPLLYHLAARGWVCVAANYRLSPAVRFPAQLLDLKRALAWIRSRIADFGGDPDFVAVTGGSAGAHLAALLALSANDPELQPGFEAVDTAVSACVPFYGIYDLVGRQGLHGQSSLGPLLERKLMPCPPEADPKLWDRASPLSLVRPDAPPFFVIHGSHDCMLFVEGARHFVRALRDVSRRPVVYAELPGAQHAFDIFHSVRSAHAVNAVTRFLESIHASQPGR